MEYRESRARVPLDGDEKRAAQKSTKDYVPQKNPISSDVHYLTEEDGYRPGVFRSDPQPDADVQRHDGMRPSGSYSHSAVNTDEQRATGRQWTRRMVMDDRTEYNHALRHLRGDGDLYYRSGRPRMAVGFMVPLEFEEGVEAGYERPRGN